VPNLVGGGVLVIAAWGSATVAQRVVVRGIRASGLEEKLREDTGARPVGDSLGQTAYWIVLLLFLPAILGTLELTGLLAPVAGMVNQALGTLPHILAAVAIGGVGWVLAVVVRRVTTRILAGAGADRAAARVGLRESRPLSEIVGLIAYVFCLLPVLIAALEALQIASVTAPATAMLGRFLGAVPDVFAAGVIMTLAYGIARLAAYVVTDLLTGIGFDRIPARVGLDEAFRDAPRPSEFAGRVLVVFAMLFATVEASNRLGFVRVADLVSAFIKFGGEVLLGVMIIAVGIWLSNLAHDAIRRIHGKQAAAVASVARFSVLALVVAMGLRQMGLAADIVNLAFGLTLGAIAVAFALSFGLGGREAAGRQMEVWLAKLRGERREVEGRRVA
jgi:hypothetical protein